MLEKSIALYETYNKRRSFRKFNSEADIDVAVIENCIKAAATAPSGANQQGYSFVIVKDFEMKKSIRKQAEENEKRFYEDQNNSKWHDDLKELKTDFSKPFLTEASYLIVIYYHNKTNEGGKVYYPMHGVGLASGMLLSAINQVGLQSLTYTPSGMGFLKEMFSRKTYEMPYMIVAVGQGDSSYQLPDIKRKTKEELIDIF